MSPEVGCPETDGVYLDFQGRLLKLRGIVLEEQGLAGG